MLTIPPSSRLCFRLMSLQDADLLFEVDQDETVMRFINGGICTSRQTIEQVMLPRMAKYRDPVKGFGIWQVRRQVDNVFLGWVLIRPVGFNTANPSEQDVEIGWRFKRAFWGRGFASEAALSIAKAVLANHLEVLTLSAIAMPENSGSIGVMQKLGMRFIKRFIHQDAIGDVDAVLYQVMVKELFNTF